MNGEVLCKDEYQTSVNGTTTCNDTVAKELFLLHAEVMTAMLLEHVILFEGTFVKQHLYTFTGCILSFVVLLLYSFLTTTETSLLTLLDELFDFF